MNPEVTAAIIAASVSGLTLVGTLAAQYLGRRATTRGTQQALEEQRRQLDRTLAEQRTRTLNERFATAAEQLGSDKPTVQLAGVYAMAGLADNWEENRQICVDVLCAYLRMPYEPDPGKDAPEPQRLAFQAIREVRLTIIRVITAHLQKSASTSWQGLNFDFTDVVFDGADFTGAIFSSGRVNFNGVKFTSGVNFSYAKFSGAWVSFHRATFASALFIFAEFSGGNVEFVGAKFPPHCNVIFFDTKFSGAEVLFAGASFSGGTVVFQQVTTSPDTVNLFSSGKVDFSEVADWSSPPIFPWKGTPPLCVILPEKLQPPDIAVMSEYFRNSSRNQD